MGNKEPAITVSSWLDVKDWYQLSMKVIDSRKFRYIDFVRDSMKSATMKANKES